MTCMHTVLLIRMDQDGKGWNDILVKWGKTAQVPSLEGERERGEQADNQTIEFLGPKEGKADNDRPGV